MQVLFDIQPEPLAERIGDADAAGVTLTTGGSGERLQFF